MQKSNIKDEIIYKNAILSDYYAGRNMFSLLILTLQCDIWNIVH